MRLMIGPVWREQDEPPECRLCGGPEDRAHDCVDRATIRPAPSVMPRPERPEERARRLLSR